MRINGNSIDEEKLRTVLDATGEEDLRLLLFDTFKVVCGSLEEKSATVTNETVHAWNRFNAAMGLPVGGTETVRLTPAPDAWRPPEDGVEHSLLIPFLNKDPIFCFGAEFGMWYQSCRLKERHAQYVRTENESQMTLACSRLGWEVTDCEAWKDGPPDNGWVYLDVRNPDPVEELT